MSEIYSLNIDSSLLSGSNDSLRNEIGGYWYVSSDEELDQALDFNTVNLTSVELSKYIHSLFDQKTTEKRFNDDTVITNGEFPVRMISKQENIKDDSHWKAILLGGEWGDISYPGILNSSLYEYFNFPYMLPYSRKEANELGDGFASREITIGYQYLRKIYNFENTITNFASEYLLPNYYLMADLSRWEPATEQAFDITGTDFNNETEYYGIVGELYDKRLLNFVSRDGAYSDIYELFAFNNSELPYTPSRRILEDSFSDVVKNNTNLTIEYLNDAFVNNSLSDETLAWAQTKMRNMLFDANCIKNLSNILPLQESLPYYMNIEFPAYKDGNSVFIDTINNNNFSSKFIKSLYTAFQGDAGGVSLQQQDMTSGKYYYTGSNGTVSNLLQQTSEQSYRYINYIDFVSFCYNNYNTAGQNENCMFVGENNIDRSSATSENDNYRFYNSKNASNVLEHAIDFLNTEVTNDFTSLERIFSQDKTYNETIAYRVEKIGGLRAGDDNTQEVLQNFWFINSNMSDFKFFDTQVFPGDEYTYNVYSYVISSGYRYQLDNFVLSRALGYDEDEKYGLEFYNPENDETISEIYDSDLSTEDMFEKLNTTYSTDAQVLSENKFLADCMVRYEPALKIYEIPLGSKKLSVLDNPGNAVLVTPYYIEDDSNRIGFKLEYNSFIPSVFPNAVSADDSSLKALYLNGNDLENDSIIQKESISNPQFFEVYRLDEKPTSLSSFESNTRTSISLEIQGNKKETYSDSFFDDIVVPNRKYYYLFRAITQSNQISHTSLIYEATLVSDGGYKYAIFNTIHPDELLGTKPEVSSKFKKVFQLSPKIRQMVFDTSDVDFTQDAESQINNLKVGMADDPLWDKTFKLRLTSKKTDRKIDLNITYKLSSE